MDPIDYKNFDINKLTFDEPIKKKSSYLSEIKYDNNEEWWVQIPKLKMKKMNENSMIMEANKQVFNLMRMIDMKVLEHYSNKSEEWIGKYLNFEQCEDLYNSCIKMPYEYSTNFVCELNLIRMHNKLHTMFFNNQKKPIQIEDIKDDTNLTCILQLKGLIIRKNNMKLVWEATQVKVHEKKEKQEIAKPPPPQKKVYSFIDFSESDNDNDEADFDENENDSD